MQQCKYRVHNHSERNPQRVRSSLELLQVNHLHNGTLSLQSQKSIGLMQEYLSDLDEIFAEFEEHTADSRLCIAFRGTLTIFDIFLSTVNAIAEYLQKSPL